MRRETSFVLVLGLSAWMLDAAPPADHGKKQERAKGAPHETDYVSPEAVRAALAAGAGGGTGRDFSPVAVSDREGVTVIQVPVGANYDRFLAGGAPNAQARADVATAFYGNSTAPHGDGYDFITVVTDFDFNFNSAAGLYWSVRSTENGIGKAPFDAGSAFGSAERLAGYVDLGKVNPVDLVPGNAAYTQAITVLMHELGHRHLAYVNVTVPNADLLGLDDIHWSYYLANGGSFMYGADWVETSPGTWVSQGNTSHYSDLDLYLMGLVPASEVPPFKLLTVPGSNANQLPAPAGTVLTNVTPITVTVSDVMASNGVRVPDSQSSPKDFRAAVVYLTTQSPSSIPAATLQALRQFGVYGSQQYFFETGGRGTVDTGLVESPPPTGQSIDVAAALAWLRSQQTPDGSWQDSDFTRIRETAEATQTLRLDPAAASNVAAGEGYLLAQTPESTDFLARTLIALGGKALASQISELTSRQSSDGGFGAGSIYKPDPLDTALARLALGQLGGAEGKKDIAAILAAQNTDGGWPQVTGGASRVVPSCVALRLLTLAPAGSADPNALGQARTNGLTFLAGEQNSDGGFGDSPSSLYGTALAYETLKAIDGVTPSALGNAEQYLAARQDGNGSFGGSVYATAIVARALSGSLLPDLVIDAINPQNTPFAGNTVNVVVRVRNRLAAASPGCKLRLWDGDPAQGGTLIGTVAVPGLGAGASANVNVPWAIAPDGQGTHTLHGLVDADAEVLETAEDNNGLSAVVVVFPKDSDLRVDSFSASPNPATTGQTVDLTVVIRSIGSRTVPEVRVAFRAGTDLIAEKIVAFTGPGTQTTSVSYTAPATPTSVTLSVAVDPANLVEEVDETNNIALTTLSVITSSLPNAKVSPSDVSFAPATGVNGQPVTATVVVHNDGGAAIAGMKVDLFRGDPDSGGTLVDSEPAVALTAGGTATVRLDFTSPSGASQIMTVLLDGPNAIHESNENDNKASKLLPLSTAPDLAIAAADIGFAPAYPRTGDPVTITAVVRNFGANVSGPFTVKAFRGDPATGTPILPDVSMPSLDPGASATASFAWQTTGIDGLQTIAIQVLPSGPDADPMNNTASRSIGVSNADFFAFTPFFSPNGDGVLDVAAFGYRIDAGKQARITVLDRFQQQIATLGDHRTGANGLTTWDGRDARGRIAMDGVYDVVFEALVNGVATEVGQLSCELDTNRRNLADLAPFKQFLENALFPCGMGSLGFPAYGPDDVLYMPVGSSPIEGLYAQRQTGVVPILVPAPGNGDPAAVDVSPDGRWAALRMITGPLYLLALDQQPVGVTRIASSTGNVVARSVFSHDSRKLAFFDSADLLAIDVGSPGTPKALGTIATFTGSPAWSDDDAFLYYGKGGLFRADVVSGDVTQVLDPPTVSSPSWIWPQELPGGGLLISEASCPDTCTETGSNFVFSPSLGKASPIVAPKAPVVAPGLFSIESRQGNDVVLGTLGSIVGDAIYALNPIAPSSRLNTSWSSHSSRLAVIDSVCSGVDGVVDNRSLLNGTARLSYRVVSDGFAIEIRGTAADLNVKSVRLQYASAANPGVAIPLVPAGDGNRKDEVLVTWVPPADGLYQVRLSVEDLAGNVTQATVNIDWARAFPLRGITVEPKYVSPAILDGRNDALNIHFDVVQTTTYQFELVNEQGATVRTYSRTSNPDTGLLIAWDGRTQGGSVAPDGLYQVKVTADVGVNPKSFMTPEKIEDGYVVDDTPPTASLSLGPTGTQVLDTAPFIDPANGTSCFVQPYKHFQGVAAGVTAKDTNFKQGFLAERRFEQELDGMTERFPIDGPGHDLRGQPIVLRVEDLAGNVSTISQGPASFALTVYRYSTRACVGHEIMAGVGTGRAYQEYQGPSGGLGVFEPIEGNPGTFAIGHSWPGDAQGFVVDLRGENETDFHTITLPVSTFLNVHDVAISKNDFAPGVYFIRFRAKDGSGASYVTAEQKLDVQETGGGCGDPMLFVTDHPATDCPGDPPDFDIEILAVLCGADPVTYRARSRATGITTTLGTAPAGQTFLWQTSSFEEGPYDLSTTNDPPLISSGRVDRTPPTIQILAPNPGQRICGPTPINVVATDESPIPYRKVFVGVGPSPTSWTDLCPVMCPEFDGAHPFVFDPRTIGLATGFYTIRASAGDSPNGAIEHYFCREAMVTVYVDADVDITTPLVSGSPFSPNADNVKDTVELRYSFAEPITSTTVVLDANLIIVRTLESEVPHDPAVSSTAVITWDGRNDLGSVVPDGSYTFRVTAHDGCPAPPNERVQSVEVVVDDTPPTAVIDSPQGSIQPSYFVHGTANDLHFDKYQLLLGQGSAPTSFTQVAQGVAPKLGAQIAEVDTSSLSGDYVLRLHVSDQAGNESQFDQPLFFGGTGMITELRGDPSTFSPNGDGLKDDTTVRYAVSRDVRATLTVVLPGQSAALATLVNDQPRATGSYTTVWNGGSLADGDYELLLHVVEDPQVPPVDQADARAPITIDTVAPQTAITNPAPNGVTGATLDVIGTAADPHLTGYTVELKSPGQTTFTTIATGSTSKTAEKLATLTGLADGAYEVRLRATDAGDNSSSVINAFTVDTAPPVVTLDAPRDGLFVSQSIVPPLNVTGTITDANPATWQARVIKPDTSEMVVATGTGGGSVSGTWTIAGLADGLYKVHLTATDKASNATTRENKVTLDATPPVADITVPASGAFVSGPTDIVGTASDANIQDYTLAYTKAPVTQSSLFIPIGGGTASITSGTLFSWVAIPPDGQYVLRLTVRDLASNTAAFDRPITVDTVPPGAPVLSGMAANTTYQLSWTGPSDTDVQGFEVWREGVKITTSLIPGHSYVDTVSPPVTMRYKVRAVDLGNKAGAFSNEVTLDGRAPETRIDTPQSGASVMGDVLVIGRAWAPVGFEKYDVLIGQGSNPPSFTLLKESTLPVGDGLLATWPTFGLTEGPYVIKLVAYGNGGASSTTQVAVTVDNTPGSKPVIAASVSTDDVTLTITTTDPTTVAYNLFRDGQLITASGILRQDPQTTYVDADRPDGTWVYVAVALDAAGNQSPQSDPASAAVSNRRPVIDITQPAEGARFVTDQTVIAVSPDRDLTQVVFAYAPSGGSFTDFGTGTTVPYEAVWHVAGLPYGDYQLRATGCDSIGCGTPDVINVVLRPAAIVLSGGSDGGTVNLAWTALVDPRLASYDVKRGAVVIGNVLANVPRTFADANRPDGNNNYTIVAKDSGGVALDTSNSLSVRVWTPTLSRFSPVVTSLSTAQLGGFSNPQGTVKLYSSTDNVSFTDTGLRFTQVFNQFQFESAPVSFGPAYYRVRTDDGKGSVSRFSNSAVAIGEQSPAPPTNIDAVVTGSDVTLSFVPSVTPGQKGTLLYRNSGLLNARPSATMTGATANGGTGDPALAFDGDTVGTAWTSTASGDSIAANSSTPAFGVNVQVFINGFGSVRMETDGPSAIPVVIGQDFQFVSGSAVLRLDAPFPMQNIRLVALQSSLQVTEISVVVESPTAGTTFLDPAVPRGLQSYDGKALATWGTLSDPSAGASVQIGTAGPIAAPVILFPASASHPQDVTDASVSIAGFAEPGSIVSLKQDGEASGFGTALEGSGASIVVSQGGAQRTALSSDGRTLLVEKGGIVAVDLSTYQETSIFFGSSSSPATALRKPVGAFVGTIASVSDLYAYDFVTGESRKLTNDAAAESFVSLDGAGSRVAYLSGTSIRVMDVATGTVLRSDLTGSSVLISPDGTHIAFTKLGVPTQLQLANAAGTAPATVVAARVHGQDDYSFSGDSQLLAHASDLSGGITYKLYATDVSTFATTQVTTPAGTTPGLPRFASGGQVLAYAASLTAETSLHLVDLASPGSDIVAVIETIGQFSNGIGSLHVDKDARLTYILDGSVFRVEPVGRFEIPTMVDAGPNVFTATANRTAPGSQPSAPSGAATVTLTDADAPNLVAESLVSQPPVPVAGESARLTAIIRNDGSRAAGPFAVDFLIRLQGVGNAIPVGPRQTVNGLAAGATTVLTADLDTTGIPGLHEISVVADVASQVAERNELDNTRVSELRVANHGGVNVGTTVAPSSARPGDSLAIATTLVNAGPDADLDLILSFQDGAGSTVATILTRSFPGFAYGTEESVQTAFTIPSIAAGSYVVSTRVLSGGSEVAADSDPVTVLDAGTVTSTLRASKILYQRGEQVALDGTVANTPAGTTRTGLVAQMRVMDVATQTLRFSEDRTLPPLLPGQTLALAWQPDLSAAPAGSYTATLTVIDGGQFVTASNASFGIAAPISITGALTVVVGSPNVSFDYSVTNGQSSPIPSTTIRVIVFDPRDGSILATLSDVKTLPASGTLAGTLAIARSALPPGIYVAALQVEGVYQGTSFLQELDRKRFDLSDTQPPTVTPVTPASGSVHGGAVAVQARASDPDGVVQRIEATIDGHGSPMQLAPVQGDLWGAVYSPLPSEEGNRSVTFVAFDAAGHASAPVTVPFIVDLTPPVVNVNGVTDGGVYNTDLYIAVTVTDAHPGLTSVTMNGFLETPPIQVQADGSYALRVVASDAAQNTTIVSISFRRDTADPVAEITSPAPGANVVVAADVIGTAADANLRDWTLSYYPAGNPSGAVTLDTGTTPVQNGKLGTFDPTPLADGQYVLKLYARDTTGKTAQKLVTINVQHANLEVTKTVPFDARVLLWASCGGDEEEEGDEEDECRPVVPAVVTSTLTAMGVPYETATCNAQAKEKVRNGRFNVYIIYKPSTANLKLYKELREAVARGEGLIVIKAQPDNMPSLVDALGVKFKGNLNRSNNNLTLLQSPITTPGTVPAPGASIKVELQGASKAATFVSGGTPAITYYGFGLGRSVLFAFDLQTAQGAVLKGVLQNSVNWVKPSAASLMIPGGVVPVEIAVENRGTTAQAYKVVETVPAQLTVLAVYGGPVSTNPPTWQGTIQPGQTLKCRYLVRLPQATGTYQTRTDLYINVGGGFTLHKTKTLGLVVAKDRAALYTGILNELQALELAYPCQATKIQQVRVNVTAARDRAGFTDCDQDYKIGKLLDAADKLATVQAPIATARSLIAAALRYEEIRWATN